LRGLFHDRQPFKPRGPIRSAMALLLVGSRRTSLSFDVRRADEEVA
jgi:hypothetical protein